MKELKNLLITFIGILIVTALLLLIGIGIGARIILFYVVFTIICIVRLLL